MAKTEPCEWCGKGHYSEKARYRCMVANAKPECTCPPYWKERGWGHSYVYGCPLAEGGS